MSRSIPCYLDDSLSPTGRGSDCSEQGEAHRNLNDMRQVTITTIRATDLTLGLRRTPVGFYVMVQVNGARWQTTNKPIHVDLDVIEWNEQLVLPSEPSSKVRFAVYAAFELGPMLGHGELLRRFEISVAELSHRSKNSLPIVFQPKAGEVVSPCTSLFVRVEQSLTCETDVDVLCPITLFTPYETNALIVKTDAGHSCLGRYHRTQNKADLNQSIEHFELALKLCPDTHSSYPTALFNLARAKFISCQINGTYLNIDVPISLFQDALDLRPIGHPDRPATQLHVAVAFLSRFSKRGFQDDNDAAEELLNEVLHTCDAKNYIYRSALLANKISVLHAARSTNPNDLRGEGSTPPMLPLSPDELARQWILCEQTDDPHALDEVVSLHHEALKHYSTVHPQCGQLLSNLGTALFTRFRRRGIGHDLDKAIAYHREALDLHPVGHPDRSKALNNLAIELCTRFERQDNDEDLDEVIVLYGEALTLQRSLQPVGRPYWSISLNNFALALSARFRRRGNGDDLDKAVALLREALGLRLRGHPNRSSPLINLGATLVTRFHHAQNDKDLDEAITLYREALALLSYSHPDWSQLLNKFAAVLLFRYEHQGNDEDVDEAITLSRESLDVREVGHPGRSVPLNSLAKGLSARFLYRGNDKDLDEAIALYREALDLHPSGHQNRPTSLNNLANVLHTRFVHRGNDKDLAEAIPLHREALACRPVGHQYRYMSLNNLGAILFTRFEHQDKVEGLDEAISLYKEALTLQPVGHPNRFKSLSNLAIAHAIRFTSKGDVQDLDETIPLQMEALDMVPVGHPDRYLPLINIGTGLLIRFESRGNIHDLDEALANTRSALSLLKTHDPRRLVVHDSLATIYLHFHQSRLQPTDEDVDSLSAAMDHLKAGADPISGGLLSRLKISLRWVQLADEYSHNTLLEAYAISIQLLDAYMSATASVSSRHHTMKLFPRTLAVNAAACALQRGEICRAVELLEQGRTFIWTQMARFRTPLDNLQDRDDHAEALVKKFQEISSSLDKPPAEIPEGTPRIKVEAEASRYTGLVDEWNKVVEEIRKLEGFSRFMLPPLFSDLKDAARDGPIIVLLASAFSCDAIIIAHHYSPVHVRLSTSMERLKRLAIILQETVDQGTLPGDSQPTLIKVLRELWDDVVCPVVESLGRLAQPGSRIWWCPTLVFNFLPLHAAGEYRKHGKNLSQLYVSSYTPSLNALIRARRSRDTSQPVSFAAIGQNLPAGAQFTLGSVEPELELVRKLLLPVSNVSFTKVSSVDSTRFVALRAMRDNHWLHFACHGTQNFSEPFNSAFLMRDQPLTLLDIAQSDLSRHEFAFLSACETALGDPHTPDELIHLAAGLQFAGVKSVIGTFWSVKDATVQRLVEEFYKAFCGDGKMDSKRAARALHRAVQSLASDKNITLDQRIVFMHIGL